MSGCLISTSWSRRRVCRRFAVFLAPLPGWRVLLAHLLAARRVVFRDQTREFVQRVDAEQALLGHGRKIEDVTPRTAPDQARLHSGLLGRPCVVVRPVADVQDRRRLATARANDPLEKRR